jgi:hypothetical protein
MMWDQRKAWAILVGIVFTLLPLATALRAGSGGRPSQSSNDDPPDPVGNGQCACAVVPLPPHPTRIVKTRCVWTRHPAAPELLSEVGDAHPISMGTCGNCSCFAQSCSYSHCDEVGSTATASSGHGFSPKLQGRINVAIASFGIELTPEFRNGESTSSSTMHRECITCTANVGPCATVQLSTQKTRRNVRIRVPLGHRWMVKECDGGVCGAWREHNRCEPIMGWAIVEGQNVRLWSCFFTQPPSSCVNCPCPPGEAWYQPN